MKKVAKKKKVVARKKKVASPLSAALAVQKANAALKVLADAAYEADKVWIYLRAPVPAGAKAPAKLPPAILVTKEAAVAAVAIGYTYGKPKKGQ